MRKYVRLIDAVGAHNKEVKNESYMYRITSPQTLEKNKTKTKT